MKEFQGSEGTVRFIRFMNGLFDLMNSRNQFAKGLKAPLSVSNRNVWEPFMDEAALYIRSLKVESQSLKLQGRLVSSGSLLA